MSAHELCVLWPLYFEYKARDAERQKQQPQNAQGTLG